MKYCIVVANGSRARFFSLQDSEIPAVESGPNLVDHGEVNDPLLKQKAQDLWSERSGKNRSSGGGQGHGYDDHRDQHAAEMERRFIHSVAERGARFAKREKATTVLVVGSPRQLPVLTDTLDSLLHGQPKVEGYSKDLAKLTPSALHDHLAKEGLLPGRRAGA